MENRVEFYWSERLKELKERFEQEKEDLAAHLNEKYQGNEPSSNQIEQTSLKKSEPLTVLQVLSFVDYSTK